MAKLFLFILIFCILFVLKEIFFFVKALIDSKEAEKYSLNKIKLLELGLAISYIFTIIFTGLTL